MEITTPTIKNIYSIFGMNQRLFLNALEGLTEEQASQRISGHNNPINWIATHTIWSRYFTSRFLGKPVEKNPYEGMFENFKPYDPSVALPTLVEIKAEWEKASAHLKQAFEVVNEEILMAESPLKNPIGDITNAGTVTFLAQHESYDIGQMAFLKKFYTKEAMKY